jgi:tRNA (adenine22-N1)-methyltransferase
VKHPLGKRLLSAANFVRQGAYLADIGTDHAYLPLFLLARGVIGRAVCADINEGPLASAVENARECGLSDRITFTLTNGAIGLSDMGITDYAICGMGGELIAEIIDASEHLKEKGVHLILQPMTKQAHLRKYLAKEGFSILSEDYSHEVGRYYLTILAEYCGTVREISDFEAEFGTPPREEGRTDEMRGYFEAKIRTLKKIRDGKKSSGELDIPEALIIEEYERRK